MNDTQKRCVLLADAHHGLSEGVRRLLATSFDAVAMVADEASLFETAARMHIELVIIDLALAPGDGLGLVRRFRAHFPSVKMIVVSLYDQTSLCLSALDAGADAFVVKHALATDLLPAADAVLSGERYTSPKLSSSV